MPTPGERKALYFLGGVALLGGIARLVGADADARPLPPEDLAALDRQLAAADSAAGAKRAKEGERKRSVGRRPPRAAAATVSPSAPLEPPSPVDLDRADARQMEALPGVGPSLARRIVAWRDSAGGLGGLEALDCVSGVGPALLARVAPHVTFSGSRRPSCGATSARSGPRRRGRA